MEILWYEDLERTLDKFIYFSSTYSMQSNGVMIVRYADEKGCYEYWNVPLEWNGTGMLNLPYIPCYLFLDGFLSRLPSCVVHSMEVF